MQINYYFITYPPPLYNIFVRRDSHHIVVEVAPEFKKPWFGPCEVTVASWRCARALCRTGHAAVVIGVRILETRKDTALLQWRHRCRLTSCWYTGSVGWCIYLLPSRSELHFKKLYKSTYPRAWVWGRITYEFFCTFFRFLGEYVPPVSLEISSFLSGVKH